MKMKKRVISLLVAVMALVLLVASPLLAKNIYVDGSNGGYANGVSWETAYPNLQPALDEALSGDIIKVAEGTYTPGNNRNDSFVLKSGVSLYGGYPRQGHGIRDCHRHFTILSGEIGTIGDAGDNVYHVVRGDHVNDARLDGFVIAGGNTTGSTFDERQGGGLRLADCDNITLDRCTFRDNRGAHGGALAVIAGQVQGFHLFFAGNQATYYGGAVYVSGGSIELTGTEFQRNSASTGGGMAVDDSGKATVGNALFNGSRANVGGGLCVCNDSSLLLCNVTVGNSTVSGNSGGGIAVQSQATAALYNVIFWHNRDDYGDPAAIMVDNAGISITYSDIEGGESGIKQNGGTVDWRYSFDEDPLFIDSDGADGLAGNEDDDLHLGDASPCIDAGKNSGVVFSEDLDGYSRFTDNPAAPHPVTIVDLGCYEKLRPIYVWAAATKLNDGSSWENAFVCLQDALAAAVDRPGRDVIWVAAGTYRPDQGSAVGISSGNRFNSFELADVEVYAGFAGHESRRSQRHWVANPTILSGNLVVNLSPYGNSYHVVKIGQQSLESLACAREVVLDGFTITSGFADNYNNLGDAWENGGGVYIDRANPRISNCVIRNNRAIGYGAGVYAYYAWPRFINCVFNGNDVSTSRYTTSGYVSGSGGGLAALFSNPEIINCTLVNNRADDFGGGIYINTAGAAMVANSIFWNNIDGNGRTEGGQINGPAAVSHSFVQYLDSLAGNHNLAGMPRFVDAAGADGSPGTADDDLRLAANSVCVDAGDNTALPADVLDLDGDGDRDELWPRDLDKNVRFHDVPVAPDVGSGAVPLVDMGAFESDGAVIAPPIDLYVDDDASGPEDGSRDHPFDTIQEAVDQARSGDTVLVYPGTYTGTGNYEITIPGDKALLLQAIYGPAATVIDCRGLGRGISVKAGTAGFELDGFTITNGLTNWGAGLYIRSRPGNVEIRNCRFVGNEANLGGGAFGTYGTTALFRNCWFSANTAHKNGGAVHMEISAVTFRDCGFTGNHSAVNGDGDYGAGGAVYAHLNSALKVIGCDFQENTADDYGGGLASEHTSLLLVSTKFITNEAASGDGGGLYCDHADVGTLFTNSFFLANRAGHYGGGFFMRNTDGPQLIHLTLNRNVAVFGHLARVENCGTTELRNSILSGLDESNSNELFSAADTFLHINFTDIYHCNCSFSGIGGLYYQLGNMIENPQLSWDGHLAVTSPCRDAGDNDMLPADPADLDGDGDRSEPLPLDLDGSPRLQGGIADMGACEYGRGLKATYDNGITVLEGDISHGYSNDCAAVHYNFYQNLCTPVDQSPVDWADGYFSVAWSGYLYVPVSGTYTFKSDGYLYGDVVIQVNGVTVADLHTAGGHYTGDVTLNGGEWVPVTMSFNSSGGINTMIFGWQPPGQKWQLVPRRYLSPFSGRCPADFNRDNDVDGLDLADVNNVLDLGLANFAAAFGRQGCP